MKLIGFCSDVIWSWPLVVSVLGPLGRESGASQCHMRPVTGPGLPVWSYKVIHSLGLCLLGLGLCTKAGF